MSQVICPKCNSEEFYFSFDSRNWECEDCDYTCRTYELDEEEE